MKIGYARVSTDEQKLDLQIDALEKAGCDVIFKDEGVSGTKTSRPALDECLAKLAPGDKLVVYKLDRLGRSTLHLITLLSDLGSKKVEFQSISEAIDTGTHYGRALFGMLSVFAQLERDVISERVTKGVQAYRKRNGKWGRSRKDFVIHEGMSISEIAKANGVSRATVYNRMKGTKK